ncbi:Tryptophan-rich sensory protein (fragment) [Mesorhizobium plurifarium]|uniref:Tryptophan-rich sensory protein n=1 Tax=Mesorhizobium plurifarium TaxID=69974 RepID=A0A090GNW8_MESPL
MPGCSTGLWSVVWLGVYVIRPAFVVIALWLVVVAYIAATQPRQSGFGLALRSHLAGVSFASLLSLFGT